MAAQAGWYPDPEGDTTRLRYWDGTQWTGDYTAAPATEAAGTQANPQATAGDPAQAAGQPYAQAAPQSTAFTSDMAYQVFDAEQIYPMTNQDRTLRLIAFILNIISCVGWAWLIFPLAWMVPMTVMSWNVYKGKRANTVAFGVCTLIFLDLISGILLLISRKDTPLN